MKKPTLFSLSRHTIDTDCNMALGFTRFLQWMNNIQNIDFLPPANEVWGKVMFLHLSVSHSVHMGASVWCHFLFWMPGPMFLLRGLRLWAHVPCGGSLSGGLCLGRSLSGGLCPGVSVKGVSVKGGFCPGDLCSDGVTDTLTKNYNTFSWTIHELLTIRNSEDNTAKASENESIQLEWIFW